MTACELLAPLEGGRKMVLATAGADGPSARMMSVIVREGCLYFQTDRTMRKYRQLAARPRAAFCVDNWQLEGECTLLGHPAQHEWFCRAYRQAFPSSFQRYTMLEEECLFRFVPQYAERWLYEEGQPVLLRWSGATGAVVKEPYRP